MKTLASCFLALITIWSTSVCTAQPTAIKRISQTEFKIELHPGPRAGCARCAAMEASFRGFSGQALLPPTGNIPMARSWALAAGAKDALLLSNYTKDPNVGLAQLLVAPQQTTVIHDIPVGKEAIRAIHGIRPNESQLLALQALDGTVPQLWQNASKIVDLKTEPIAGEKSTAVERLLLESGPNDLTFIMGHVSKGKIRFHDGSSLEVKGLVARGRVFVIGCNTVRQLDQDIDPLLTLAIGRKLSYEEGAITIMRMLSQFQFGGTYRDALLIIQNEPLAKPINLKDVELPRELKKYSSPKEQFAEPVENEKEDSEESLLFAPAIGIVKADQASDAQVIGIGLTDWKGEFFVKRTSHTASSVALLNFKGNEIR